MHTHVVGGTGMLTRVTSWLVEQGHVVWVVSRRTVRVFGQESTGKLNHITVDYRDANMLRERINEAITKTAPLLWRFSGYIAALRMRSGCVPDHYG